jgi:hypothetical protein
MCVLFGLALPAIGSAAGPHVSLGEVAWVNGVVPTSPGYPLHPNQAGEQNMANRVLVALGAG